MAQQFNNISFLACSRTIEKLHMRGIDIHLIPEARVIPGALEAIVDRMQQGWVYIRV
jgi:intracellular sulfur oxidation DsrE/DsrF family protein